MAMVDGKKLPRILGMTYRATKEGWAEFMGEAAKADDLGYVLVAVTPLGTASFGAVWRLSKADKAYGSFVGDDEDTDIGDADEGHVRLF